jgi:hypothetical protein
MSENVNVSENVNYLVEPRGPFAQFVRLILFLSFSGSPWTRQLEACAVRP